MVQYFSSDMLASLLKQNDVYIDSIEQLLQMSNDIKIFAPTGSFTYQHIIKAFGLQL